MTRKRRRNRHHYVPTSRGGSNARVNQKKKTLIKQHSAWHVLFYNLKPYEACRRLVEWDEQKRALTAKERQAWSMLFGNRGLKEALQIIQKYWTRHDECAPLYLADFLGERENYPFRVDFLDNIIGLLSGLSPAQKDRIEALKAIVANAFTAFRKERAASEKEPKITDASRPVVDIQLGGIAKAFSSGSIYKAEERVALQIRYDGYFLTMLDGETRGKDGVIKYVNPERLAGLITGPLIAAIVYGEIKEGDKVIFTLYKNRVGLWRQDHLKEKLLIK